MILGIGSDLVDIRRIEKLIAQYGVRLSHRLFTEEEIAQAAKRLDPAPTYAKRFAAKEACAKALGIGMQAGVFFRDLGVINHPNGQPAMRLTGGALKRLEALTPPGRQARIHLTMSDEPPFASAFVIIEAALV